MILLLLSHPDVQKKAHDELDKVVGADRLPNLDDIKDLPYVRAVQDEVWFHENYHRSVTKYFSDYVQVNRLRPFGPLGLPHSASEEFHVCLTQSHHDYLPNLSHCRFGSTTIIAYQKIARSSSTSGPSIMTKLFSMNPTPSIPTDSYLTLWA